MSEKEIYFRLEKIFHEVFDDESIKLTAATNSENIADWHSIEHIDLISAVEEEFGIRFKMSETSSMRNVGEMVKIISQRSK